MSTSAPSTLEEVIRRSGESWLIDSFGNAEESIRHLRQTLESVNRLACERLKDDAPDLSDAAILELYQQHPLKVRTFLQALGGTRTPDMLLMAWRVIQGMEIKEVSLSYQRQKDFRLRVVLESPDGEVDEAYDSSNVHDFALLRHIGAMTVDGQPILQGFYALRLKD